MFGFDRGVVKDISIHAPRVGSDYSRASRLYLPRDFNPRSPCGERPEKCRNIYKRARFQSTLPVWGATYEAALALERTGAFQSTLPVWGATPPVGGIPLGPG